MKKISVIVLSYNSEKTILDTLKSVQEQKYQPYEIIISDDGSRDNSVKKIRQWEKNNLEKKVMILENKINQGITKNINKAIKYATGEWIKVIAGDDILYSDCLEKNMEYVNQNKKIEICFSKALVFNEKKDLEVIPKINLQYLLNKNNIYKKLVLENCFIAPTVFFKKSLIEKYGGFDEEIRNIEDWPMWLKLASNNIEFGYLEKVTVKYRKGESISNSLQKIENEPYYNSKKKIYEKYIKKNVGVLVKWHYFLEFKVKYILIKIFSNKKSKLSSLSIKGIKIFDIAFILNKIKEKR